MIFTDNTTIFSELKNQTLKKSINNSLREVFLLIVKWDILIVSHWISTEKNNLADALSRFDDIKMTNMCSH
jgi:hypothetical protein